MFNAVVILANAETAPLIRALIAATGQVTVMRELHSLPGDYELTRLANTLLPDLFFVDLTGGKDSLECLARIRGLTLKVPVIGLGCGPETRLLAHHLGATGIAAPDCSPDELRATIRRAMEVHSGGVEPHLITFLPSKAGSGCSTVVVHTAFAVAALGKRVVVIDADLRSSVMGLMLGLEPVGGVQAVLKDSADLDRFILRRNILEKHGSEFLLSTRSLDAALPEWDDFYRLLNFIRGEYDLMLVDLPELINPATVEVVRRSRRIFTVCTPELPSLRLALQRLAELKRIDIAPDRIGVLVNRVGRGTPEDVEFEKTLGHPVAHRFPNDYTTVSQSILSASPLDAGSELSHAFARFASALAGVELEEPGPSLGQRLRMLLQPGARRGGPLAGSRFSL